MKQRQPIKRQRPPMPPLAVRVQVAERQFCDELKPPAVVHCRAAYSRMIEAGESLAVRLKFLLQVMFTLPHLDHSPALVLRSYNPRVRDVASRYSPHAHDASALTYLEKSDHQQKTTGRKPGAERTVTTKGSDIGLKSKFNRLEGRLKPHRKSPIKSRGFAKGTKRKWPNRSLK